MVVSTRKQVLYIEDNPANFALVRRVLESTGRYDVTGAQDGPSGLEMVQGMRPDVVLLDLDLPGMDGLEIARQLKANASLSKIPLIAISAGVMKWERKQALDVGCCAFVEKPFDIAQLRALVDDAMTGS